MFKGIGASAGYGIGNVVFVKEINLNYENKTNCNVDEQKQRYKEALAKFCEDTKKQAENAKQTIGAKEAEILSGHILMINDPYMNAEIEKLIEQGQCAESALESICDTFIMVFSSADDELTKQRAADVKDIKNAILRILLGISEVDISSVPANSVIITKELTPSMTAGINKDNVVGIVTEIGGKTSHAAILARAMEIPAVLSVKNVCDYIKDNDQIIVDGNEGQVFINPDNKLVDEYTNKRIDYLNERKALAKYIGKETVTADGDKVELVCNIGNPDDVSAVIEHDGEGVGLFRTEFLFMDRNTAPTEEEQFEAYKKVAIAMKNKPVIIRTLDVGGDKDIPYLGLKKEENPFLGFRAIRYCLKNKELYRIQLRALVRASAFGDIRIMVPLVTNIEELRRVKYMVKVIMAELDGEKISYNKELKIGVMIETPAASLIADILAKESDFFSIGTNDLTQYTMAVDRGNADVEYLYSSFEPAVLRSIKHIIECAVKEQIPVGMCGESASDKNLIPLLISFGLTEYSVSPSAVLNTRKIISKWAKEDADNLQEKVMSLSTVTEIVDCINKAYKK